MRPGLRVCNSPRFGAQASPFALPCAAMADPRADVPAADCPNCGAPLATPRPNFCPSCGQETHLRPPRLGEFLQQFGGAYFATEGALWRTLRLLLLQPGELTRQYLAGRRRHYVLPLRLYLTVSLAVLLALRLLAATSIDGVIEIDGGAARAPAVFVLDAGDMRAGIKDGVFFCERLPQWVCKRLQKRIDVDRKALLVQAAQLGERFIANLGAAMFVVLPAFALWLKLAYLGHGLRYTEHLVFALHVHAFWFLALAVTLLPWPQPGRLAMLAVPVYTLLAMRRVYRDRWGPRLLRAGVVSVLYGLTLGLALAGVALAALLF